MPTRVPINPELTEDVAISRLKECADTILQHLLSAYEIAEREYGEKKNKNVQDVEKYDEDEMLLLQVLSKSQEFQETIERIRKEW